MSARLLQRLRFASFALLFFFPGCSAWRQAQLFRDPLSAEEHWQLAKSYEKQDLTSDAMRELRAALAKEPKHVAALVTLGTLALQTGDLKTAKSSFRRALKVDRGHPGAKNNLAMVFLSQGNLKKAERLAREAAASVPLRPFAQETLAQIREREGRWEQADREWEAALAAVRPEDTSLKEALLRARKEARAKRTL